MQAPLPAELITAGGQAVSLGGAQLGEPMVSLSADLRLRFPVAPSFVLSVQVPNLSVAQVNGQVRVRYGEHSSAIEPVLGESWVLQPGIRRAVPAALGTLSGRHAAHVTLFKFYFAVPEAVPAVAIVHVPPIAFESMVVELPPVKITRMPGEPGLAVKAVAYGS